ncbi:MAG: class I SAM-dependent methyltransferase [Terriglobales bacterium]
MPLNLPAEMARRDFYASPFGVAYSAYMERPGLSRLISRVVWGGDSKSYYDSMCAVAEVADGGTIIDCPCGAGPALRALRPNAEVRYLAADLSPSMLRRARKRAASRGLDRVEFIEANAGDLPLPADSAELFLSFWGLHCFEDPPAALAEAARVLKPGARLVGSCFVRGDDSLRQRLLVRAGSGDFGQVGTEPEVAAWLEAAGFEAYKPDRSGPMLFFDARFSGQRS